MTPTRKELLEAIEIVHKINFELDKSDTNYDYASVRFGFGLAKSIILGALRENEYAASFREDNFDNTD